MLSVIDDQQKKVSGLCRLFSYEGLKLQHYIMSWEMINSYEHTNSIWR